MPNRGRGERLLPKSGYKLGIIAHQVRENDLNGVLSFMVCMTGSLNDTHTALAKATFKVVFALQDRLAGDSVCRRHPVVRTGHHLVTVAMLTQLTLSHFGS